ncbi:hypothetical protein G4177_20205 [Corallococcus sp. ZKHCc1 1396]|uniref:Uncharacterized protein n=2 Tax=Myxococcaceae TaxID=31 RepID=A0ABR9PRE4_9BACT|nr:hypothetical protein [Corallococcus soli]
MEPMRNDGTPPDEGGEDNIFAKELAPAPDRWVRRGTWISIVLLVLVGVFMWLQGGEDRALNAMSPSQRQALFRETRDEFEELCLPDGGGSRYPRKCAQLAEFLTHFSECDSACLGQVQPFRKPPRP